ncbi:hypothetical protein NC652_002176 [Populus alba x Populus x berolinensis]|nr:hypothetical protein NC652_002176 [Populus alba x Populus x berolinensis]
MSERNVVGGSAMLTGFLQAGAIKNDGKLFDEMPDRNVSSWNSITIGYCGSGLMREASYLFDRIGGLKNLVSLMVVISWNAYQALDYKKGACSHYERAENFARMMPMIQGKNVTIYKRPSLSRQLASLWSECREDKIGPRDVESSYRNTSKMKS